MEIAVKGLFEEIIQALGNWPKFPGNDWKWLCK